MLLESKSGNWKYLPQKWTQIPKYDEDEPRAPICIETSNDTILGNVGHGKEEVELLKKEKDENCQKWTRSKAVDGYFALKTEHNETTKFLTVGDNLNLKLDGKGQKPTDLICTSARK